MFNLLLALITGLVIGWNFHSFFMQLNPPNILKNDINITQLVKEEIPLPITSSKPTIQEIKKEIQILKKNIPEKINKEKNISTPNIPNIKRSNTFYDLLHNDLFSDAMSLYVDASETQLLLYQSTLVEYFEEKSENDPQITVEQILEFQELEPSHTKINMEILHQIEASDYAEQAKILLNLIKEKMDRTDEYTHQLLLKKTGEHFTIVVKINNEPLTLLLDTGATLTMVNEEKLSSSLTIIKEHIVLHTAGGKIDAKLQEANSFSVDNIQLENFQVVSSSFEQENADGLLGMNFFKKFKFKIDQEKAILFLSEKDNIIK